MMSFRPFEGARPRSGYQIGKYSIPADGQVVEISISELEQNCGISRIPAGLISESESVYLFVFGYPYKFAHASIEIPIRQFSQSQKPYWSFFVEELHQFSQIKDYIPDLYQPPTFYYREVPESETHLTTISGAKAPRKPKDLEGLLTTLDEDLSESETNPDHPNYLPSADELLGRKSDPQCLPSSPPSSPPLSIITIDDDSDVEGSKIDYFECMTEAAIASSHSELAYDSDTSIAESVPATSQPTEPTNPSEKLERLKLKRLDKIAIGRKLKMQKKEKKRKIMKQAQSFKKCIRAEQ